VSSITCSWSRRPRPSATRSSGPQIAKAPSTGGHALGPGHGLRAENIRADSRQAATEFLAAVTSNVSSITCSWSKRAEPSVTRSPDLESRKNLLRAGMHSGLGTACAQKIFEPTHVRLLRNSLRPVASNVSSITCSWSRRPRPSATRSAGSQIAKAPLTRGHALGAWARLARRKYLSRLTSGCYGESLMAVASNVSSIICFWSRRPRPSATRSSGPQIAKAPLARGHALGPGHGLRAENI
jgi:hypothetical protein